MNRLSTTLSRMMLLAGLALATLSSTPATAQCRGDLDGDFSVTVDELITAVRNSLDQCAFDGPRFINNRDGTVTDQKTALVWEQKNAPDGTPNPSDPHDADNLYSWSSSGVAPDGTLVTDFLFALNGATSSDGLESTGCFAGHCDWRVPTIEEVAGIVDPSVGTCAGGAGPCIDPTFGPTQADGYWSASTFARNASRAWLVDVSSGGLAAGGKNVTLFARAVRGFSVVRAAPCPGF